MPVDVHGRVVASSPSTRPRLWLLGVDGAVTGGDGQDLASDYVKGRAQAGADAGVDAEDGAGAAAAGFRGGCAGPAPGPGPAPAPEPRATGSTSTSTSTSTSFGSSTSASTSSRSPSSGSSGGRTGPAASRSLTDSSYCTSPTAAARTANATATPQQHVTSEDPVQQLRQHHQHNNISTPDINPSHPFYRPLSPRAPDASTATTPVASVVTTATKRSLRKISPRLLERLHLLSALKRTAASANVRDAADAVSDRTPAPGRIPDAQLQLLESLHHQNRNIVVSKRGTPWSGRQPSSPQPLKPPQHGRSSNTDTTASTSSPRSASSAPRLELNLEPALGGAAFSMAAMVHESDASSIVSISDRLVPSDSEPEPDPHADTQKYRLPELGKSRGTSRNGVVVLEDDVQPPTPPPKDLPFAQDSPTKEDNYPYFNPGNLSRTASIYTLSRASFSNQISQLTSIKLPAAASLASSIAAIPTSSAAARALNDASGQIRIWMTKVTEVLEGLDAEDDIEWAAAGGRDGLGDVDAAISRFEGLIDVYVSAIEQLETRDDIASLGAEELQGVVDRMERILKDWKDIKDVLKGVKEQVELAMEWEELWNTVLGEIGQEMEALSRLIFEMEERRHRGILDAMAEPGKVLDINELETIVEEAPSRSASAAASTSRFKGDAAVAASSPQPQQSDEDKNLVSLFARMQPLRASLDFFPMRLSAFVQRARKTFPTGCEELEKRVEFLEAKYQKIDADAESLRKELGEDRWVIIFRKASEKALKMCESVDRSILKLREALEEGVQHTNPAALAKKLESYEAKKEHYGPAIQQVLGIIDKGVQTRLTVNGEILRLQADMKRRWTELEANIKGMDFAIEQLQVSKLHHQLRDSISTILSEQRSVTSSMVDTPGSSPASSVVLLSRQSSDQGVSTPYAKSRTGSFASSTTARTTAGKRLSSLPTSLTSSTSGIPRKTPLSRSSVADLRPGVGVSSRLYSTPTPARSFSRADSRADSRAETNKPTKPRWNSSTNLNDTPIGHNFKPLSATTPSPYRKVPPAVASPRTASSSHHGSPLGPNSSASGLRPPSVIGRRPPSAIATSRTPSASSSTAPKLRTQQSTPSLPSKTGTAPLSHPPPSSQRTTSHLPRASIYSIPGTPTSNYAPSTTSTSSTATIVNHSRKTSTAMSQRDDTDADIEASPTAKRSTTTTRPGTSQAGRRASMLPQPKRVSSDVTAATAAATAAMNGRTSRAGLGKRASMAFGTSTGTTDERPRWRN
ncbi:uncharacterized protein PV09_03384 [Verruconis gallopava]|uniref:Karyogamy protein n=1 Tax=Verruconis gallopava TaxID=253628 RepID=A0A0D1XS44_9PEZI|nr:uncharacterized protein PV09_03384 [Verruconis gallopava]KIW05501.1 hypothetical protein PV09_03384 [Verruconis gallopava]